MPCWRLSKKGMVFLLVKRLGLITIFILLLAFGCYKDFRAAKTEARSESHVAPPSQTHSDQTVKLVADTVLSEQTGALSGTYFKYQPKVEKNNLNQDIYLIKENYYISIGLYSSDKEAISRFDRSPALFLIEKNNGTFITKFRSSHSGDSYFLRPFFYKTISQDDPIIILAEMGTEYTWGVRVFLVEGINIKDIGDLNVGADTPKRPFMQIRKLGEQIQFGFTTDVIYDPGDRNEKSINKDNIKYIYESGKLREEIKR